jgi:proteasome beta subunit
LHQIIVFKRRVDKGATLGHLANPTVHMGWRHGDFMEAQDGVLKTGTSTVGITFNGGVVVGADHRATMGHFIANKSVQKLFKIGENLALTTAGLVGHAQSLSRTLAAEVSLYELRRGQNMTVKGAATFTANILAGRPHWVQLLIVGVDPDGSHVYSIDSAGGSIPDVYCATGSGSPYMYGVLEDGFSEGMSRNDAVRLAARALNASGQRDAASGNGMDLAVITAKDGFVPVEQSEIDAILKKK